MKKSTAQKPPKMKFGSPEWNEFYGIGRKRPRAATASKRKREPESMTNPTTKAKPAKRAAKPASKVVPLKTKPAHKAKRKVIAPKKAEINPTRTLAEVYKKWTGKTPSKELTAHVSKHADIPADVVALGRVTALITASGKGSQTFGENGPLMVTDAHAKRIWLLSTDKAITFDIARVHTISYLAKKPKFGDHSESEYVHAFERTTTAHMKGHVGEIKGGGFRITGKGIVG